MGDPILLGKRDAARALGISIRTLDTLIARNKLPVVRIGRRVLLASHHLHCFALNVKTTGPNERDLLREPRLSLKAGRAD